MLRPDDLWFLDDPIDEPAELMKALPEVRQELTPTGTEEDLGLRSLLENPDALAHAWWRDQASKSGRPNASGSRARAAQL